MESTKFVVGTSYTSRSAFQLTAFFFGGGRSTTWNLGVWVLVRGGHFASAVQTPQVILRGLSCENISPPPLSKPQTLVFHLSTVNYHTIAPELGHPVIAVSAADANPVPKSAPGRYRPPDFSPKTKWFPSLHRRGSPEAICR